MEIRTALTLALVLIIALWVPYFIFYIRRGRRTDTPGSPGGSHGVTPTSARTLEPDRLDPAQTMRGGLVTDCVSAASPGRVHLRVGVVTVRGPRGCRFCLAKFLGCAVQTSDGRGSARPDARSQARIVRLPSGARKGRHQLAVLGTFANAVTSLG